MRLRLGSTPGVTFSLLHIRCNLVRSFVRSFFRSSQGRGQRKSTPLLPQVSRGRDRRLVGSKHVLPAVPPRHQRGSHGVRSEGKRRSGVGGCNSGVGCPRHVADWPTRPRRRPFLVSPIGLGERPVVCESSYFCPHRTHAFIAGCCCMRRRARVAEAPLICSCTKRVTSKCYLVIFLCRPLIVSETSLDQSILTRQLVLFFVLRFVLCAQPSLLLPSFLTRRLAGIMKSSRTWHKN